MRITIVLALAAAATLAGCATSRSGDVYSRDEALREQTVRLGTVESVRPVTIQGTRSGIGAASGAVVGGVAGSGVGHGRGSTIAGVLGAVGGGVAGQAIEEGTTRKSGVEITVRLDNGELRAIVQEETDKFVAGQRVRLLTTGGVTRVSP
ncbi:MAG TPA: glycine zipper 2TM domain-containing protein [Burkholderiales bacterium]|jgi:outer membrane lipoprotein SlyB|nr:glycine zipper 2TM domain-containing protein [Burkholderiales bacterium]